MFIVEFQFHKGAIRTYQNQQNLAKEAVFQFHKGAIRTSQPSTKFIPKSISIP